MAEDRVGDDDRELLDLIAGVFDALDPVPAGLVSEDFSYVRWAAPDADIGVLFATVATAPVRDGGHAPDVQTYRFERSDMTVMIDLDSMTGEVRPWRGGSAWIEGPDGLVDVDIDDSGEFMLTDLPSGSARMWVRTPDGDAVTPWFHVIRGRSS
jgi:hypothetical protein